MINRTTATPSNGHFGDLIDSFFAPENFDPKHFLGLNFDPDSLPSVSELLGEPASARDARRKSLETIKSNIGHLDDLLDVASRRLFLTNRDATSVRLFEQLASEALVIRRLVQRAEAAVAEDRAQDMEVIVNEANAWVERIETIRKEAEGPHLAAVGERFVDLFSLHHREFEHRVAQLLNFDGFAVERWNGGAGDLAADVVVRLPAPDGRRVIVQCKHTSDPRTTIGSGVIQQVSGTRQAHDAELAFVVTTGSFTKPAIRLAKKLDVHLADCNDMLRWALGGFRLLDLLDVQLTPAVPPARGSGSPL
ncbi:restriction endonuclease [Streptomyces lavendulocolor]|uniref:restriction endonuclease n=1 Tax=Streptomyces lavendulocolor TaxID=67316 RepID=UPI0033C4E4DC